MKQLVERRRREREQRCHAAAAIQRWYRWQKAGQAERADYVRVRKAALTLQAAWRGVLARRNARVCGGGGGKKGRGAREEEGRKEGWRRKTSVSLLWIQYKKSRVSDNSTDRRIANIANKSVVVILMNESETHYCGLQ